jgi:amino acid permease
MELDQEPLLEQALLQNDLRKELTSRHLNMIVIGGTIGTGLFLGSGQSLAVAGPVGSLIAFSLIGALVYSVVSNLGEMVCLLPLPGSFNTFGARFVEPALGFTMG